MSATTINFETTAATLLVVDDDTSVRENLRSIFDLAGHYTVTAADAPTALRFLNQQHCDLVMLDVELPDVDGVALCRLLRAQATMQQLPVIIFSANELGQLEAIRSRCGAASRGERRR